jgi:hypothetical protein
MTSTSTASLRTSTIVSTDLLSRLPASETHRNETLFGCGCAEPREGFPGYAIASSNVHARANGITMQRFQSPTDAFLTRRNKI